MRQITRREFLTTTLAGAGLAATSPALLSAETTKTACKGSDIVPLGRTGIKVSRLAQGTGFNGSARSSDHTRMGRESFDRLLRHSVDSGVRFIDMADLYGTHSYVRDTIKDMPRDKFVLLSKIWPRKESWNTPSGGAKEEIDRFRKELGSEVIDICLIHCATNDKWLSEYERIRDGLSEMKQKGAVRAVGVSCHDFGALKLAAENPWVEVIFARINNRGGGQFSMDGSVEDVSAVLKTARANGKAVVGMKIFGAGKLIQPEQKDASLKYVFSNQLVDAITVGMLKTSEIDDTMQRMAKTMV
jgi:aryl-alcohol dehydrogenase-like predicted oxidoreductase